MTNSSGFVGVVAEENRALDNKVLILPRISKEVSLRERLGRFCPHDVEAIGRKVEGRQMVLCYHNHTFE